MNAEYLSHFGDDNMVVDCARVSLDKTHDQYPQDRNDRLIQYLARNGHWTPFAHPQVQFRITAPVFVSRQWYRHLAGLVRSEVSRRYVDDKPEFYTPTEWRSRPDSSIKQGSGEPLTAYDTADVDQRYSWVMRECEYGYKRLLESGVAPEQARMMLPQSMMTAWLETGSLMAYARICRLRLDSHTQAETRELAKQVNEVMAELFPVSWAALMESETCTK